MNLQPTGALLRELKGAPISVLIALLINQQPTGELWIQGQTGYSQNPVRAALYYLAGRQLVSHNNRFEGWQLTQEAYQTPLIAEIAKFLQLETSGFSEIRESHLMTLEPSTTTAFNKMVESIDTEAAAAVVVIKTPGESHKMTLATQKSNGDGKKNESESQNLTLARKPSLNEDENESQNLTLVKIDALHAAGIMGKTAESIARLPHIKPDYVAAHAAKAKEEGKPIQILITRLRDGDPAPAPKRKELSEMTEEERYEYARQGYLRGISSKFDEEHGWVEFEEAEEESE